MSKSRTLQLEHATALLDALGGEPLAGSGFETQPDAAADELWEDEVWLTHTE